MLYIVIGIIIIVAIVAICIFKKQNKEGSRPKRGGRKKGPIDPEPIDTDYQLEQSNNATQKF